MENSPAKRLQEFIIQRFGTKTACAKYLGISFSALDKYIGDGKNKSTFGEKYRKKLDEAGLNLAWYLTGQGDMFNNSEVTYNNNLPIQQLDSQIKEPEATYDNIETIPQDMLNRWFNIKFHDMSASACLGAMVSIDDLPHSFRPLYVGLNVKPENLRGIIIRGDSMKDAGINDGELIVYEVNREVKSGHEIVCILNGVLMIKLYIVNINGEASLHSSHNGKEPIPIKEFDNFQILGVSKYKVGYRN